MARIVIKDLAESAELDRNALATITGGSFGARQRQSAAGGFQGKGRPIELSAQPLRTVNERLKHSKCVRD